MRSTIAVGPIWARLSGPPEVLASARGAMTLLDPGAQHSRAFKAGRWDGQVCLLRRSPAGDEFPSGLTWRVAAAVRLAGHERPTISWPERVLREPLAPELIGFEWRPYQVEALNKALRAGRCALQCPTRSGKTEIGIEFVRRTGGRALWVTHLKVLLEQTPERFKLRLGLDVAVVGGGRVSNPGSTVTVGMVQTLSRMSPDWFKQFDCLVMDEAHHAGATTWQDVAAACTNASARLGLSGTMATGNQLTDLRIEGALGPTVVVASTAELADQGFVARPRVVLLSPPAASYPTYESVRETVCPDWRDDPRGIISRAGGALFREAYRRGVTENELRNRKIIAVALRHLEAGDRFLILCNRVPHARALHATLSRRASMRPVYVLDGSADQDERVAVLGEFRRAERGAILVCTPFFREGVDLPQIDAGMIAGGGESDIAVWQGLSRMLTRRSDKAEVLVYDFVDGCGDGHEKDYMANHYFSRRALYERQSCAIELEG